MTTDEINTIANAVAQAVAKATAQQMNSTIDEKFAAFSASKEKLLKNKFELVLSIDCTDEEERARSREAFRWLIENHETIQEPVDWLVEFHSNRKSAINRALNWVMTGLAVVAFYLAMLGFNIKHN